MTISDLRKTDNFFLLAGPCVIEGEEMALRIADRIVKITDKLGIPYVFKGSYRKANRSRLDSFTGIGDEKALKVLRKIRETFDIPIVTDIHSAGEAAMAAEYVDVLQIPGDLPIDFSNPKRTLISGLFQETAKVGGQPRKFLTYIPEDRKSVV